MDEFFQSALTFLLTTVFGLTVVAFLSRTLAGVTPRVAIAYYLFHGFTTFMFYLFCLTNVTDSTLYYADATAVHGWFSTYGFDKSFILFIEYPLINFLGFTFFSISFVFGLFGYVGTLLIYAAACEQLAGTANPASGKRVATILLLLPAHAFFTSDLGKDSIIIFGIGLVIFAMSRLTSRPFLLMLGMAIAFHVRPWIGAIMMGSMGASLLLSSGVTPVVRLLFATVIVTVLAVAIPLVGSAVGLAGQASDIEEVGDYLGSRHSGHYTGGSTIDLQSQGLLLGCFTYLFRPLFFDVTSNFALVASFENIFYLGLFALIMLQPRFYSFVATSRSPFKSYLFVHFASMLPLLAYVTPNLGIAMRQKTMLMPAALILFALYLASKPERRATMVGTVAD